MTYTLWLTTPTGQRIKLIKDYIAFSYTCTLNAITSLIIDLPADYNPALIRDDNRIYIYRKVGNVSKLETDTFWFIRKRHYKSGKNGDTLRVWAMRANYILDSRIIAYDSGTSFSSKAGAGDDLMKAIIRENLGNLATETGRSLDISVATDTGEGPFIKKGFSRQLIDKTLVDLAGMCTKKGTPIFFDVIASGETGLQFQTFTNLRGVDRGSGSSHRQLVLSKEQGDLTGVNLIEDSINEVTVVYGAGQGREAVRVIRVAKDEVRLNKSPFARRESLADARHTANPDEVQAEADNALYQGQPQCSFKATISSPTKLYGQHWNWGDRVVATYRGRIFDCLIETVQVTVTNDSEEKVTAKLQAQGVYQ